MLEGRSNHNVSLGDRNGLLHANHHCFPQLPKKDWGKLEVRHGLNPLLALTHQSVLDLNAACRSKCTKAYWLFSS